jgi:hypothetical protein
LARNMEKMAARAGIPELRWEKISGKLLKDWATALMHNHGITRHQARKQIFNRLERVVKAEQSMVPDLPIMIKHPSCVSDELMNNLVEQAVALSKLPDSAIDTSDIPEVTDWSKAEVGKFYRPAKASLDKVT